MRILGFLGVVISIVLTVMVYCCIVVGSAYDRELERIFEMEEEKKENE